MPEKNKKDQTSDEQLEKESMRISPLEDIYQAKHEDGQKDYFSTFEKSDKMAIWKKWLIGFFILLLILAGSTVAGFFAFSSKKKFSGQNIKLEFLGPQTISSGDSFSFTVLYENNEILTLKNAELTLNFPESFLFEESSPMPNNDFKNSWDLKNIPAGSKGKIIIKGHIVGENNSSKTISARLNFEPENFSSPFDARQDYLIKINESALKIAFDFPPRLAPKSELKGMITLRNISEKPLKDVRLAISLPSDFVEKKIEPPAKNLIWEIAELTQDKPYEITVAGIISGSNGELKEIKATASLRNDKNEFIAQTETNTLISIISPNLEAVILTNDKTGVISVDWGDTLAVSLKIKNAGDQIIRDVAGQLAIDSTAIDWQNIRWTIPGKLISAKNSSQKILFWTKDEFPDLLELSPGKETILSATLSIIERPPKNVSTKDLVITVEGQAVSKNVVDLEGVEIKSDASPIEVRITTQVQLRPEARYTDDEYQPLGTGPIPPEAGKTTTYQIQWYLSNASNEVTDAKITTALPQNVFWKGGETGSGALSFDPATREVAWTINRVPARSGLDLSGLSANFTVSITLKESEIGSTVTLTEQTALEALDGFTNQIIQKKFDVLTTDIATDPKYAGQGKVAAPTAINTNTNTDTNINSSAQ
ncbi:MAG TPA: hypothetical protein VJ028_00055 [Patescibacteria group bacterium]|nr:hypothetical protein [Patescibacteria group bacterium]